MKILELCPFSSGICGVWIRVKQESLELSKLGHKVAVFSSNLEKGTDRIAEPKSQMGNVSIYRFPTKKYPFSKNVLHFDFSKQLKILSPDLVITHLLHPHSFQALKICNSMNIPIFLVTHAPFNVKRKFPLNLLTKIWNYKVKKNINKFDKIISITNWEIPYLEKLVADKNKITYIPNGIPKEFFEQKEIKEQKKVLFLGRIAPVKNLEILISSAKKLPKIKFSIVGSSEKQYLEKLKQTAPKNITFYPPIYDLKEKIKLIDEHKIFVLPSLREAMPQVLIEAMSRGKIVISSNTDGGKEIIEDKKNGFLFNIGDFEQLAKLIKSNLRGKKQIKQNAKKSAKKYSWQKLIKKYEELIKEFY